MAIVRKTELNSIKAPAQLNVFEFTTYICISILSPIKRLLLRTYV